MTLEKLEVYYKAGLLRKVIENKNYLFCALCETLYYVFDKSAEGLTGVRVTAENMKRLVNDPEFGPKYFEFTGRTTAPGIMLDYDPETNLEGIRKAADYLKKQANSSRMDPETEKELKSIEKN